MVEACWHWVVFKDPPNLNHSINLWFSLFPHSRADACHTFYCITLIFNNGQEIYAVIVGDQITFCHFVFEQKAITKDEKAALLLKNCLFWFMKSLLTKPLCCIPKPVTEPLPVVEKTGLTISLSLLCQPVSPLSNWPLFCLSRRLSTSDVFLIKLAGRFSYAVVWCSRKEAGQKGMGWQQWVTRSSELCFMELQSVFCFLGNYIDFKNLNFKKPI